MSMALNNVRQYISDMSACKQHADPEKVRSLLRQSDDMPVAAWCVAHGKECRKVHSDTLTAGNTCTDHSSFGKRCGMAGPHTKIFYIWAAVTRQVRPKIIIAEKVTQFGLQPYERELGDIYACVRTVVSAAEQGWATTRIRQFVFMFHTPWTPCWQWLAFPLRYLRSKTSWFCNQCSACLRGNAVSPGGVFGGKRNRAGGRAGLGDASRPDVKKRHAEGAVSHVGFHDEPGSFLYALNASERKRLEKLKETCQFCGGRQT